MGSAIEWTDETLNCVTGCTKVSAGCRSCYAEGMTKRLKAMGQPKYAAGFDKVVLHPEVLSQPLRWRKPRRVFLNSMSDTFHPDVPDDFIARMFAAMEEAHWHTFLVLTKRIDRAASLLTGLHLPMTRQFRNFAEYDEPVGPWPLPNVSIGASIENQSTADERIPHLLKCPAAVRFISAEPLLGPADVSFNLTHIDCPACQVPGGFPCPEGGISWVIAGCESGPHRRPSELDWFRSLRDQCTAAGVPFFLKQMVVDGKLVKMPELDGRVWDQMPEVHNETQG